MKKHFLIIAFLGILVVTGRTQTTPSPWSAGDLAVGVSPGTFSVAGSWYRLHPVALKKKFYVGYGVRFTSFFGKDQDYVTAPANVSEGNFFKLQNEAKLDTLVLESSQTNSLNLAIFLGYQFTDKFSLGFNIDAIGFSFGGEQSGVFHAASLGNEPSNETAEVTNFNLLLTGDYDLGSLNSEFYGMYKFNDKFALRGGLSFFFAEYTTDRKLAFDNDRFRKKTLGGMLAVSYLF